VVQKYLVKQNEIGFKEFCVRYGNLPFNKVDSDEPAPEVKVLNSAACVNTMCSLVSRHLI